MKSPVLARVENCIPLVFVFACASYPISFYYYYSLSSDSFEPDFHNFTVCYITAIYGGYEKSCKRFAHQTIKSDFICFTDNSSILSNGWTIDTHPYHLTHPSPLDDANKHVNSLKNNNHTFNIGKYYKQAFKNIPRLSKYDVIIWIDGSIEITKPKASYELATIVKKQEFVSVTHHERKGKLFNELNASFYDKYTSPNWLEQSQPIQNLTRQYEEYIRDGYDEEFFIKNFPNLKNYGVWVTCLVAYDNRSESIKKFLDLWYLQSLNYTTQDQISFSYVVQKLKLYPKSIDEIYFNKQSHGA